MTRKVAKPRKPKPKKRPTDVNQHAHFLVEQSTQEAKVLEAAEPTQAEVSRVMAALGRRGGQIGGKRRAASMSQDRRREIALKAARSRWDKRT